MKTKIVKRYAVNGGNRFIRFQDVEKGHVVDVRTKTINDIFEMMTSDARKLAVERFEELRESEENR